MPEAPSIDPFHDHDHAHCTATVLARAEEQARADGVRLTPVRRRVLEILLESHRAMGAYDVLERLAAEGFGKQPPVAYRALDFLVEQGFAHRVRRLNAYAACLSEHRDHAPGFLICRNCEQVAEAESPGLHDALAALAAESGFVIERSTVELLGLCRACAKAETAAQA
ncbi:Fur family transcriptional regulator [Paracoccus shanxieyensis]|uniref:Transcriptional repressor n=1 Tax=Paracoccus shanxieyensis TaxID=2675752 RepID=A0A6L6IYG7_9RHOB|nr:transcriptional repressor [Paracoccus shanxieyensis]MTH64618.1 transcriptional repressor [Paracoccus shanxieyensis]MTH87762.1 transcriptional repressor [Paracoccus shanxieyensis]